MKAYACFRHIYSQKHVLSTAGVLLSVHLKLQFGYVNHILNAFLVHLNQAFDMSHTSQKYVLNTDG